MRRKPVKKSSSVPNGSADSSGQNQMVEFNLVENLPSYQNTKKKEMLLFTVNIIILAKCVLKIAFNDHITFLFTLSSN